MLASGKVPLALTTVAVNDPIEIVNNGDTHLSTRSPGYVALTTQGVQSIWHTHKDLAASITERAKTCTD